MNKSYYAGNGIVHSCVKVTPVVTVVGVPSSLVVFE